MQIQAIIPASIKLISSIGISFVVKLIEVRIEPVLVSEHCLKFVHNSTNMNIKVLIQATK